MLVRRLGVGTLSFLALATALSPRVLSETGDKQLARVKGVVGYQETETSTFKAIFGREDLPDDAYAVTKPNGQAVLRLKDSSEIDIGENTRVQVGAFNAVSSGTPNSFTLLNGALHFNIRHPQGGQSNYKFQTATSQIAVRGTDAFLVSGSSGTQVSCVSCGVGDVTVQVGTQTVSVVTGQTLTVLGTSAATATFSVATNTVINNPAINQFNNGQNPFNPNPAGNTVDPTNSLSGNGTGATGAGGLSGGTIGAIAGGAAAAGVVVATTKTSGPSAPAPTPPPQIGPLVVQVTFPAVDASFPVPFTWPFTQVNATGQATIACSPASIITCTVSQTLSGTTLNGTISGNILGPGAFTVGAAASGYTIPPVSFNVYSSVAGSPSVLNFTGPNPQTLTLTQNPAGTTLSTSTTCVSGASIAVTPASGPSPLQLTIRPISAPSSPSATAACTITVAGQGNAAGATATIPVNITTTSIGVSSKQRKPL